MDRRRFLAGGGALAAAAWPSRLAPFEALLAAHHDTPPDTLAGDEAFWRRMRPFWVVPPDRLDLDHATFGAMGTPVIDALTERVRQLHQAPSSRADEMWRGDVAAAREALAELLHVDATRLALTAGGPVALATVLEGVPLTGGDEVLVSDHAGVDAMATLRRRAAREGIGLRVVTTSAADAPVEALPARFAEAAGPRTRLALVPHVSGWTGEALPVEAITATLRPRGVAVLVDGSQAVGLLDVDVPAIACDAYAAALDAWIGAPIGTGVLVLRPEWIGRLPALHARAEAQEPAMRQYEWAGPGALAERATVRDALTFQRTLGAARKRERLRLLGAHWQSRLADVRGVRLLSPVDNGRATGVGTFVLDTVPSAVLARHLFDVHRIVVRALEGTPTPFAHGVRVAPSPITTTAELDRLVDAVRDAARRGIPGTR